MKHSTCCDLDCSTGIQAMCEAILVDSYSDSFIFILNYLFFDRFLNYIWGNQAFKIFKIFQRQVIAFCENGSGNEGGESWILKAPIPAFK